MRRGPFRETFLSVLMGASLFCVQMNVMAQGPDKREKINKKEYELMKKQVGEVRSVVQEALGVNSHLILEDKVCGNLEIVRTENLIFIMDGGEKKEFVINDGNSVVSYRDSLNMTIQTQLPFSLDNPKNSSGLRKVSSYNSVDADLGLYETMMEEIAKIRCSLGLLDEMGEEE